MRGKVMFKSFDSAIDAMEFVNNPENHIDSVISMVKTPELTIDVTCVVSDEMYKLFLQNEKAELRKAHARTEQYQIERYEERARRLNKYAAVLPQKKCGKNAYTQFVRVAQHIRKGDIDSDHKFIVGDNFRDKSTASASKYLAMKDDLGLDGKTMTVKDLLDKLKECMPDEKDLTLTAICWGLMPKEFRESLVEELNP